MSNGDEVDGRRLRLYLMSPAEVRSRSSGEVTNPATFDDAEEPVSGGLHCPAIFGQITAKFCPCGRLSATAEPGLFCTHCGSFAPVATPPDRRIGHIELAAAVIHPLAVYGGRWLLADLVGVSRSELAPAVYYDPDRLIPDGVGSIRELLARLDVRAAAEAARRSGNGIRRRLLEAVAAGDTDPRHLVLEALPVIPARLRRPRSDRLTGTARPCQADEAYARIIRRCRRLRRLLALAAPDVIVRHQRSLLQRAVDVLFLGKRRRRDGDWPGLARGGLRPRTSRHASRPVRKRADYSARAVAVPDPALGPDECVLPWDRVGLTLFEPHVIGRLQREGGYSCAEAARAVIEERPQARDALEAIAPNHPVLVGRPERRDRDRFRAFLPRFGEGSAVRLPVSAFLRWGMKGTGEIVDLHLPLSTQAVQEANGLRPSRLGTPWSPTRDPVVAPQVVLGCCLLTLPPEMRGTPSDALPRPAFAMANLNPLRLALACGKIRPRQAVLLRLPESTSVVRDKLSERRESRGHHLLTTAGRALLNDVLPEGSPYYDRAWDRPTLQSIIDAVCAAKGAIAAAATEDSIGQLALEAITRSGASFAAFERTPDRETPARLRAEVERVEGLTRRGLLTAAEAFLELRARRSAARGALIDGIVRELRDESEVQGSPSVVPLAVASAVGPSPDELARVFATFGFIAPARGPDRSAARARRWRGTATEQLQARRARYGRHVPDCVAPSLSEGLGMRDAWDAAADMRIRAVARGIGARRRALDYLLSVLDPVLRDYAITEVDCGTKRNVLLLPMSWVLGDEAFVRLVRGRVASGPAIDPRTGEAVLGAGETVTPETAARLAMAGVTQLSVRSPLTCEAVAGLCACCYGISAHGDLPRIGTAVGRLAATELAHAFSRPRLYYASPGLTDEPRNLDRVDSRLADAMVPRFPRPGHGPVGLLTMLSLAAPRFPQACRLAKAAGIVISMVGRVEYGFDLVVQTPDGQEARHYIPSDAERLIAIGDAVQLGEPLTAGNPDLREVWSAIGLERTIELLRVTLLALAGPAAGSSAIELLTRRMTDKTAAIGYSGDRYRAGSGLVPVMSPARLPGGRSVAAPGGGLPSDLLRAALAGFTVPATGPTARAAFGFEPINANRQATA